MSEQAASSTDREAQADPHAGDEATVVDALERPRGRSGTNAHEGLPSPHRHHIVVVPLVMALVFFFGPALAFVLGDRAEPIDNRPLAAVPSPADGWSFITDFNVWANDHLPLRAQAVEGGTELSETVFDEPPPYAQAGTLVDGVQYPRVIDGEDGWLYFGGDVSGPCDPVRPVEEVVGSIQRLSAAIEASGRDVVVAVVPDKSTMVPEHLPDRFAGESCAAERKEATWDALEATDVPLIDMRSALSDAQDEIGGPLYRTTDSHWDLQGASVFVREVVDHLDPGLLAGEADPFVESGEVELTGDLGRMIGTPTAQSVVDVRVDRPGVALSVDGRPIEPAEVPELGTAQRTVDASSTGAALIPGRTVVLGDSFFASARSLFAPFFDELGLIQNQSHAPQLAEAVVDADTVVIEVVERSVADGDIQIGTPEVVDVIEQRLADDPRRP